MWARWEGSPVFSVHGCQMHRVPVSLLDWYFTERAPYCLGDTRALSSGLCLLSQATSGHIFPILKLSIPRLSPQSQPVYTAPRFLSISHYHPC